MFVFVYTWVYAFYSTYVCVSQRTTCRGWFCFYCVGPRNRTQVVGLHGKCFSYSDILLAPKSLVLFVLATLKLHCPPT